MGKRKAQEIARKLRPPRCPQCGRILRFLDYEAEEIEVARFLPSGEFSGWNVVEVKGEKFCCPECDAILFRNKEDAEKFLIGEWLIESKEG